jgi:hypothetical protein
VVCFGSGLFQRCGISSSFWCPGASAAVLRAETYCSVLAMAQQLAGCKAHWGYSALHSEVVSMLHCSSLVAMPAVCSCHHTQWSAAARPACRQQRPQADSSSSAAATVSQQCSCYSVVTVAGQSAVGGRSKGSPQASHIRCSNSVAAGVVGPQPLVQAGMQGGDKCSHGIPHCSTDIWHYLICTEGVFRWGGWGRGNGLAHDQPLSDLHSCPSTDRLLRSLR